MTGALYKSLALCLMLARVPVLSGAPANDPEDELKGAVVLSFVRYTEWPATDKEPISIGVAGGPAFAEALRRMAGGKTVNNRPIQVLELSVAIDPKCCQVIYFANEKGPERRQALEAAQNAHVLTIGDAKSFLEAGGAVKLMIVDGRMSFEINMEALHKSGVNISSKLLRFGLVRGNRGVGP